jgi:hypothetical protein
MLKISKKRMSLIKKEKRARGSEPIAHRADEDVDPTVGLLDPGIGVVHIAEAQIPVSHAYSGTDPVFEEEMGGEVPGAHPGLGSI